MLRTHLLRIFSCLLNVAVIFAISLQQVSAFHSIQFRETGQDDVDISIDAKTIARDESRAVIFTIKSKCDDLKGKNLSVESNSDATLRENGVTVTSFTQVIDEGAASCKVFALIRVNRQAKLGIQNIQLVSDVVGVTFPALTINITDVKELIPGRIPPGLSPQVDILWGVVPKGIVKDNFGGKVSKRFYCIEVVVGNNTGYDLQLAAVGFQLGPIGKAASVMAETRKNIARQYQELVSRQGDIIKRLAKLKQTCDGDNDCNQEIQRLDEELLTVNNQGERLITNAGNQAEDLRRLSQLAYRAKVPVSSYAMARGSASYGQFWNIRNIGLSGLRALGPIFTALNPFLGASSALKTTQIFSIITDPLPEGIDSVFPDRTISQLQRLDDQALRDGMIIQNNRQIRTRVFIPKKVLRLDKKYINDVAVITQSLGELHIVGDLIEYRNRVSVTSGPSGEITPPPTVDPLVDNSFDQGETGTITLTGTNLEGAKITSTSEEISIVGETTTTLTTASAPISIKKTAPPGAYSLFMRAPTGSQVIRVRVDRRPPASGATLKLIQQNGKPEKIVTYRSKSESYEVIVEGDFLLDSKLVPEDNSNGTIRVDANNPAIDGKSLKATITVLKGSKAGTYFFRLINPSITNPQEGQRLSLEVKKKDAPEFTSDVRYGENGNADQPTNNPIKSTDYVFIINGKNLQDLELEKNIDSEKFNLSASPISDTQIKGRITIPADFVDEGIESKETSEFKLTDIDNQLVTFKIKVLKQPKIIIDDANKQQELTIPEGNSSTITLKGKNFAGFKGKITTSEYSQWKVEIENRSDTEVTLKITAPATYTENPEPMKILLRNSNTEAEEITVKVKKPSSS